MAKTVKIVCDNPFHRGNADVAEGVQFSRDQRTGKATAQATRKDAEALLEADPDAYACPELEDTADGDDESHLLELKHLGTATAAKLAKAGVEGQAALAEADAEELAAETDIDAEKIGGWQKTIREANAST